MQGGTAIAGLPPLVIPVFVSNLGCPHRCVFCDQVQNAQPVKPDKVAAHAEEFISHSRNAKGRHRMLAFYGGSFTGIDMDLFDDYLDVAKSLIKQGVVHAAKASTRPDMVSKEVLTVMAASGFSELEIGIQSLDDEVLRASARGHTAKDSKDACKLVKKAGMKLGVQLMPGLPGEDSASFARTIDDALKLGADYARLYPCVVLAGTALEEKYRSGEYIPLSLDMAVRRTLYALVRLEHAGCSVLRMGIPSSPQLKIVAGPYHESFGFLVRARGYHLMSGRLVSKLGGPCELRVNPRDIPELLGFRRSTLQEFRFSYSFDETIPRGYIRAYTALESACIQLQDILEYIL